MRGLVVLVLIGLVAAALMRSLRAQRRSWVARLALPGTWAVEDDASARTLVFEGTPTSGRYADAREGIVSEAGRWRLVGSTVVFETESEEVSRCEVRLFAPGRIGLHGPARERLVLSRRTDNVVALPSRIH